MRRERGREGGGVADYPPARDSRQRLEASGWWALATFHSQRLTWAVEATYGRIHLLATGRTEAQAWWRAARQAEAMLLLDPP